MKKTMMPLKKYFLFLLLLSCLFGCVPCHLARTYSDVDNVRTKVTALIDSSSGNMQNYTAYIAEANNVINNAIAANDSQKHRKNMGKLWRLIKSDSSKGLYDRFLVDWNKYKVLPGPIRVAKKQDINKLLDEIVTAEDSIKSNCKPCKTP
jgi:hypothetical protein